jgi:ATP-binding cassette subfamily B (MDR/TAP) protein 1
MTKWKRSSAADPTDLPPSEESEEVQSFPSTTSNSPDVVSTDISTTTQLASIRQVFSYGDFHVKVVCLSLGLFFAAIAGSIAPVMAFYFAKAFEELVADPNSPGFMKQVKELTWTFLVLGVVAFVSLCGYATLLETSAGNMTKDFQQQWFRALLRQDMAYFDVKDVSGVATLISTNGAKFKR